MKKLKIDREYFGMAFELSDYEHNAYFDTETGEVILVSNDSIRRLDILFPEEEALETIISKLEANTNLADFDRQQLIDVAQVLGDEVNRYRILPKQNSDDDYRVMQEYIQSVSDHHIRELLEIAIQGSGAFRRFKDVLYRYPEVQQKWFEFRDQRQTKRIRAWLKSEGVDPEFE